MFRLRFVLLLSVMCSIVSDRIVARDHHGGTVNSSPTITDFVLYAEHSIRLGDRDNASGGDVGVRSTAPTSFGVQLTVGHGSIVQTDHDVLAPSVDLEDDSHVGIVETNALQNNGGRLTSQAPFPASAMPPLPLAPVSTTVGSEVIVPTHRDMWLPPGTYGALTVKFHGKLLLGRGSYFFTEVSLDDFSVLVAIAGPVQINVGKTLLAGRHVSILPDFRMRRDEITQDDPEGDGKEGGSARAGRVTITVGGTDSANGEPAVSIGENSFVRALIAATHGTVALAERVHLTGAVAGFDIVVAREVDLDFESGFPVNPPGAQGSQPLSGYFGVNPDPTIAPVVGPVPPDTTVPITVSLPGRDPEGLKKFVKQVSDPKDPNFRKYLSQAQFYATYGASAGDYESVKSWATNAGLSINATYPSNLLLSASGTASQIANALHVNLYYRLREDGSNFIAVDRDPSVDLSVPILEIGGLTNFMIPRDGINATGNFGGYRAADLRNAYLGPGSSCQKFDGTGQVVGIVGMDTYDDNDIKGYDALQLTNTPPNPANVSIAADESCLFCKPFETAKLEATLDVEMVQAMAPGATIRFFKGAYGTTTNLDNLFHTMANSNPPLTVVSCSLVFPPSPGMEFALLQMAVQGVSFFTASGDYGDIGDPQSNQDFGPQTLVGGTILTTNPLVAGLPKPVYPANYYGRENTWNDFEPPKSKDVTGGGIMNGKNKLGCGLIPSQSCQGCFCFPYPFCCGSGVPIPDYQVGVSMATNGGSTTFQNFPDVAMVAENLEIFFQGSTMNSGGTSAAAPLWAGFTALVNQSSLQNGAGLSGYLNPTLYDIGLTRGSFTDLYAGSFNDIQDGVSNFNGYGSGFASVGGYDLTTGWGSPKCQLLNQLSTTTPLTPNIPLDLIEFTITTGDDNLRGDGGFISGCGTGATADVLLKDGSSFTVTLHSKTDNAGFDNNTTHVLDFAIPNTVSAPLTESHGIAGVRINIQEHFNVLCTADNWDIKNLGVTLFNPGSPKVCQLNLVGNSKLQDGSTGLVRLSASPGGSGVGPNATFYTGAGSGCQ